MNKRNVKSEFELYLPMKNWLQGYLEDNYKGYKIITVDAHSERLDRVLAKYDIVNELAVGIDIQIDVLGIAKRGNTIKLFFIEVKKTNLTLRDLGQLWSYCKLIDPEEAFLMTSAGLGTLKRSHRGSSTGKAWVAETPGRACNPCRSPPRRPSGPCHR